MIILLSPSKTMDFESEVSTKEHSVPIFLKEAEKLAASLAKMSAKKLGTYMSISEKLATLNHQRYQEFKTAPQKQALFAYQGDVYRDIHPENYSPSQLKFAQKHLRTLSGLYGILKPLDLIKPYRLEMKFQTPFWKDKLDLSSEDLIINLSSKEYSKPLNLKALNVLNITFRVSDKIIPIYAKIARGTMANFIIENQITDPAQLEDFSEDGWKFQSKTEDELTFTR